MRIKRNKNKVKQSGFAIFLTWLLRIFLFGWAATIIFPLYWMLSTSMKTSQEFMLGDVWKWPAELYLVNYTKAWSEANMGAYMVNTLFVALLTIVLFAIMLTTTAYILGKYQFRFLRFFRGFYFVAMMIPGMLLLVPLYTQMQDIGGFIETMVQMITNNPNFTFNITDNLITLAVVYAVQALPVPIFLLTGFVQSVDKSFVEAAKIDGAGEFYIFSKVIMPFIRPIVLFQCLTQFMGTWNEYLTALTFLENDKNFTLSVGIQRLIAMFGYQSDYGAVFAGLTISLLPILILYILFQKTIQNGTDMSDGLK